jgi:hypothetical protein
MINDLDRWLEELDAELSAEILNGSSVPASSVVQPSSFGNKSDKLINSTTPAANKNVDVVSTYHSFIYTIRGSR